MPDIQTAYDDIVSACLDNYILYNMDARTTIKLGVSYYTYCDCSSLISWALTRAGYFKKNPWFTTRTMQVLLLDLGFTQYSASTTTWQPGDILWRSGHTEMVYSSVGTGGRTMGAHQHYASHPADDVSIHSNNSYGSSWTYIYRAPDSYVSSYSWYQSKAALTYQSDEQYGNAVRIYNRLASEGWTNEAIAGALGNFTQESTINPGVFQGWITTENWNVGYGLAQWTPGSAYRDWSDEEGIDRTDPDENGEGQLSYLLASYSGRWIQTSDWPYSWSEYISWTGSAADAASCFMANYERPGDPAESLRRSYAQYWLGEILTNFPRDPGNPDTAKNYIWLWGALWDLRRRKRLT